ncbi:MAG: methylmalonyl Co-A mutase-associated GTPase MeaB [Bacteroidetes bacterium]|nr:methylmalonyl Co-A mutase-associated GTPase MeaB [Bacteroidota bacterium]
MMNDKENINDKNSALKVNKGIEQPPSINEKAANAFKRKKPVRLSLEEYLQGILSGNITILSKAITLIESSLQSDNELAQKIIEGCMPHSGKSIRIGITGVPGAGKSTFIEAFGKFLTGQQKKIAVLAVDPSSSISKGSLLGDKTRMETLAVDPLAFVRPSPAAGSLGGVAKKTREIIILCEAAGFEIILIETVGVGQSEIAVHSMVDFFLLLMIAGAGDELQGIKRGIIEMCDAMIINKADGDNILRAHGAKVQYENALHLFPQKPGGWLPRVLAVSSINRTGIDKVWDMILSYIEMMTENGFFRQKRDEQKTQRFYDAVNQALFDSFYNSEEVKKQLPEIEKLLQNKVLNSYQAAEALLRVYFKKG